MELSIITKEGKSFFIEEIPIKKGNCIVNVIGPIVKDLKLQPTS